jgi:hypothetical protein
MAVVGLAGTPDDIETWTRWVDRMVNDPLVQALATRAVAITTFLNDPWVRAGLVISGLLILIWPLRWFWRLRHRLVFWGRRIVSDQVWISFDDALEVVRNSRWADRGATRSEDSGTTLSCLSFRCKWIQRNKKETTCSVAGASSLLIAFPNSTKPHSERLTVGRNTKNKA